jgi:vacuolar-type H+-ATPase subunit E/Vma4
LEENENNNSKISHFLGAINKYTQTEYSNILNEINDIERQEIEKSKLKILKNVDQIVQDELFKMRSKIHLKISQKTFMEKKHILRLRKSLMKDFFLKCEEKLLEFVKTPEYLVKLKKMTDNIFNFFEYTEKMEFKIYLKKEDFEQRDLIKTFFKKPCEILLSKKILIGGVYGYNEKNGIIVDETLDSKLKAQQDYFIKNFGLKLVQIGG